MKERLFAVIMAGGSGTRLYPASRVDLPKQFLRITGERTLLAETILRVGDLAQTEDFFVVVGENHVPQTVEAVENLPVKIIAEPCGKNTAACIGLAAIYLEKLDADAPMCVLPADHFVADNKEFRRILQAAGETARRKNAIVTIGIKPSRPETGYGYIETAADGENEFYAVERFVEKPSYEKALEYVASGKYLWNSGIFVFTPRLILEEIARHLPALAEGLNEIRDSLGTEHEAAKIREVYEKIDSISIDYGVMEKTSAPLLVFPSDFGWSDVGSWQAVYELRENEFDESKNLLLGDVRAVNARQNLVYSTTKRFIALLGVENLAVVETPDVLLVTNLEDSQNVKKIPELLQKLDRNELR